MTKPSDLKGIHLAVVDDYIMFRQGLAAALSSIEDMEVSMENSKPLQSKVEIIYGVWTEKNFLSPRTVENHRTRIMDKCCVRNTAGLVVFALKNNLVHVG